MAKKSTKKSTKKAARKPAAQSTKKSAKSSAKRPAKKSAAGAAKKASGPRPVSTGRGASPLEIGSALVAAFNSGQWGLNDVLWSKDLVSVEGLGVCSAWDGRKAVDEKNAWWNSTHRVHGGRAEGPYVGASSFGVKFTMDVEDTTTGDRMTMVEIGVYTVLNGKIVREEFMYSAG